MFHLTPWKNCICCKTKLKHASITFYKISYKKAVSIKPDYAEAYYNIGIAYQEQGNLEKAVETGELDIKWARLVQASQKASQKAGRRLVKG